VPLVRGCSGVGVTVSGFEGGCCSSCGNVGEPEFPLLIDGTADSSLLEFTIVGKRNFKSLASK
jgi:hypothetical protein